MQAHYIAFHYML